MDGFSQFRSDFKVRAALGEYSRYTVWNKFGHNEDVDTASPELIAAQGGQVAIMLTGDTLDISSDDANDAAAGTGAQSLLLVGIDENANPVTEIIALNGLTTVTTVNQYLGINRAVVLASGATGSNAGNITLSDTGATVGIQAYLPAGGSVTEQCIFHTPINHTFLGSWLWVNALKIAGGSSPRLLIRGISYSRVTGTSYDIYRGRLDTAVNNQKPISPNEYFQIGGREVLYFTADTDTNNTVVNCRFSGLLVDQR